MPRWGLTDRPDANQATIVEQLRAMGYYVLIAKRPLDLWVVEPTGQRAVWVEVNSYIGADVTKQEANFMAECPMQHWMVAYTADDVIATLKSLTSGTIDFPCGAW